MITMVLLTAKDKVAETKSVGTKPITENQEKTGNVCLPMLWLPQIRAALNKKAEAAASA